MRVYATPAELLDWVDDVQHPERLLRAASLLVGEATVTALYSIDRDGYPVDEELRAAFRDATCAQAALWAQLNIDPTLGAAGVTRKGTVTGKSIGSASISRQYTERTESDLVAAATQLCTQAVQILTGALPNGRVKVTG